MALIPKNHPVHTWQELWEMSSPAPDAVQEFERKFAESMDAPYAVSFPMARVAIQAALEIFPKSQSDVLVTAYTCIVVPHAIVLAGYRPRFVDINLDDFNSGPEEFKDRILPSHNRAIVTHMYGNPVDMAKMETEFPQVDYWVEDTSLGLHPAYRPKRSKCVTVYSLGFNKLLSTIHGGMAVTHDRELRDKLVEFKKKHFVKPDLKDESMELIRFVGARTLYAPTLYNLFDKVRGLPAISKQTETRIYGSFDFPRVASRPFSNRSATLGLHQLSQMEYFLETRKKNAFRYYEAVKDLKGVTAMVPSERSHFSHYTIRIPGRDQMHFREKIKAMGIELGSTMEESIPLYPLYTPYADTRFPVAEQAVSEIVNLPNYPGLTEKQFQHVVNSVKKCLK